MHRTLAPIGSNVLRESGLTEDQLQQLAFTGVIAADPGIVSGAVVFAGTRVPVYNLRDYLDGGDSVGDSLKSFPTVRQHQIDVVRQVTQWGTGSMKPLSI